MVNKDDYGLYFLNDLYDDEVIQNTIASFKSRLYNENLKNEIYSQNIKVRNGALTDIKINRELNQKYDLPINSYSLRFNCNIIPFYSEKKFMESYGYNSMLSSVDIMNDKGIFNRYLFFFIGDYMIYDIKIVIGKQECIVFIPIETDDTASNMSLTHIQSILNNSTDCSWSLLLTRKSDFYYTYTTRSLLITDNKIYISNFKTKRLLSNLTSENCWTIYLTSNNMSKNAMIATDSVLLSDSGGYYFTIPDSFRSLLVSENTNMLKCLIVNEPDCSGKGIYVRTSESLPRFQIPFKKNPIPVENLITWKYDSNTSRKLHPIVQTVNMSYPNIYDFSEMMSDDYISNIIKTNQIIITEQDETDVDSINNSDLIQNVYDLHISWMENVAHCINHYDSYIDDYIKFYGNNFPTMKINGTIHPLIQDYLPIANTPGSFKDYINSEYRGDYRAWSLSCLIAILNDNPKRYDELYHVLYSKYKKFITRTYTYQSERYVYERSIRDNGSQCDHSNDHIVYFNTDHTFIKVFNQTCKDRPCILYINGIRKHATYVMTYGSDMYIYFPTSYIGNHEDIQIDIEIDIDDICTNILTFDQYYSTVNLESFDFPTSFSMSNICFYSQDTGYSVDVDAFKLQLKILSSHIKYNGSNVTDMIASIDDVIYTGADAEYDIIDSQVSYLNFNDDDKMSHKKINLNNLIIQLADDSLFNQRIAITNTNFYNMYTINETLNETRLYDSTLRKVLTSENEYIILVKNGNTDTDSIFYINNFKGTPSSLWFRVYYRGRLVNPKRCLFIFDGIYNGEVQIFIEDLVDDGEVVIDYLGHDEEIVYNDIISPLKTIGSDIISLDNIIPIPFDIYAYRLFIDGYRVPDYCISTVGQSTMILIDKLKFEVTDESNLIIYRQIYDDDPYDFLTEKGFLSSVCKDDKDFRQYMVDKYKK